MDVSRISETYSNLGRIGGGRPNLPEPQEDFTQGQVDGRPETREHSNLLNRFLKTTSKQDEKSTLSATQAFAVSEALTEAIRDVSNVPISMGTHDVTQLRLIPSRYV